MTFKMKFKKNQWKQHRKKNVDPFRHSLILFFFQKHVFFFEGNDVKRRRRATKGKAARRRRRRRQHLRAPRTRCSTFREGRSPSFSVSNPRGHNRWRLRLPVHTHTHTHNQFETKTHHQKISQTSLSFLWFLTILPKRDERHSRFFDWLIISNKLKPSWSRISADK